MGHEEADFVKEHSDSKSKYPEGDIIKMLECLVGNIFVVCTKESLLSTRRKQLASRFNFTYRYIYDVLSINNPDFENYLGQMYPV